MNDKNFGKGPRLPPEKPVDAAPVLSSPFIPVTLLYAGCRNGNPESGRRLLSHASPRCAGRFNPGAETVLNPTAPWLAREPIDMRAGTRREAR